MKTVNLNETIVLVDDFGNKVIEISPTQGNGYNLSINNEYINLARLQGSTPVCQNNISNFSIELQDSVSTGHVTIKPAVQIFETDGFSITFKDGEITCLNKTTGQFKRYSFE